MNEHKLRTVVSYVKLTMLLLGTLFGAYIGFGDLYVTLTERAPTPFQAGTIVANHKGQKWLEIEGRIAVAHKFVRPSTYDTHRGKGLAYVHVPVVASNWHPGEPVNVVATYGPMTRSEIAAWETSAETISKVRGQLRRNELNNAAELFPGLDIAEPLLVVNEGTEPQGWLSAAFFLSLMVVMGLMAVGALRSLRSDGA